MISHANSSCIIFYSFHLSSHLSRAAKRAALVGGKGSGELECTQVNELVIWQFLEFGLAS